ncbi:MAG: YihY/virulence factor BrkB family protein [Bryobacteraceae bacterium]
MASEFLMDDVRNTRIEAVGSSEPDASVEVRKILSMRWPQVQLLLETTVDNWFKDNVPRLGASLAFYTMLSLAPLLIVVIAVAGFFFGREAAEGQLVGQIQDVVGRRSAEAIETMMRGAYRPAAGIVATVLGMVTLAFSATTAVGELRNALNIIWCVPERQSASRVQSLIGVLRDRTYAFGIVLGVGFLLLVSLAVNAGVSAMGSYFGDLLPIPEWVLQAVNFLLSFAVVAFLFALIYKIVPDIHLEWRDVALGAVITSLLFSIGKFLIGLYLGKAGVASAYGAAGSLVILLLWVYYSAQIFFFGAEFTRAYAHQYGSHPCDRTRSVTLVDRISERKQDEAKPKQENDEGKQDSKEDTAER